MYVASLTVGDVFNGAAEVAGGEGECVLFWASGELWPAAALFGGECGWCGWCGWPFQPSDGVVRRRLPLAVLPPETPHPLGT